MANASEELRQCPTRVDGAVVLFAHKVGSNQCQARQRARYHKCFTCVFNNAYVAAHGMPEPATAGAAQPEPRERRVRAG